jgi:hypothetical protein
VDLPPEIRERFRRFGRQGGRKRAANLSSDARRAGAVRAATARWIRCRFGASSFETLGLPGGDRVDAGLADLAEGKATVESLLVSLAAPRLRREGVPVTRTEEDPEERLFAMLARREDDLAHARYTALLRQMASFADGCRTARPRRGEGAR